MFQDSIVLKQTKVDPDDPYGEQKITQKVQIANCRFDLRTVYSGSNNDRQVVSNATIIMMNGYTWPWIEFDESYQGKKIEFQGHDYTITSINRDLEPFTRDAYQFKLGVI